MTAALALVNVRRPNFHIARKSRLRDLPDIGTLADSTVGQERSPIQYWPSITINDQYQHLRTILNLSHQVLTKIMLAACRHPSQSFTSSMRAVMRVYCGSMHTWARIMCNWAHAIIHMGFIMFLFLIKVYFQIHVKRVLVKKTKKQAWIQV